MRITISLMLLFINFLGFGQRASDTYTDHNGNTHLKGSFSLARLEKDTLYQKWYEQSYAAFHVRENDPSWKKALKDVEVDIYLGTWCGDSKNWVPKFVKLWDSLGLDRAQLHFTALYNGEEKYKQGPNGEEKGKQIHTVPTFIVKKEGNEYARIVETPCNDLETDLAQIALGYPSAPNYRAATYMINLLETQSIDTIYQNFREHVYEAYELVSSMSELNTLGYVLLRAGEVDKALVIFQMNTYLFRYNPNVYDSYGEALAKAGRKDEAIQQYEKVLKIDPENKNAIDQLDKLRG